MSDKNIQELDARMDLFESLVPMDHPFGIWVNDYCAWYAKEHGIAQDTPEDKSRVIRFVRAKILGGMSLGHGISLVDMGRIVFASHYQHKRFSDWLNSNEYNPDFQDNIQEIIDNELRNRQWLESKLGIKFEPGNSNSGLCSSKNG